MATNIVIKNAAGTNVTFQVARQPSGNQSAIFYEVNNTVGMNRTGLAKIELSARVVNGKSTPVASVVVPYGGIVNGNYVKAGQVSDTRSSQQPADAPTLAKLDCSAFAKNAAADAQVQAMFDTGLLG